jgi:hypothetical protein
MIEVLTEVTARDDGVLSALTHLRNGSIEDALTKFAEEFCFTEEITPLAYIDVAVVVAGLILINLPATPTAMPAEAWVD